jgi:hypothetical protein
MNAESRPEGRPATTDLDADRLHRSRQVPRCPRGNVVVGSMVTHVLLNMAADERDWSEAIGAGIVRDRRGVRGRRRGDD